MLQELQGLGYGIVATAGTKAALEAECPDLLKEGFVEAGILTNLPYANNRWVPAACVLEKGVTNLMY